MASSLDERVAQLEAENALQRELIERLGARIVELERELGRNSSNSSLPPSSDDEADRESRQERRARERAEGKAKRKPGKQPGAPGAYLARVDDPDRTVVHRPVACAGCGEQLGDAPVVGVESRQVFDLAADHGSSPVSITEI